MSSNSSSSGISGDMSVSSSTGASVPVDATTAEQSVQANSQGSSIDMNETVANVSELQKKAPQVWNAILQGIAQTMISQMQNDNNQLIQMMKHSQENT